MCVRVLIVTLVIAFYYTIHFAEAQQPGKVYRVGYLVASTVAANRSRVEAFRNGIREAGYIEGQNIAIEYRYADRKFNRLPALAAELVRLKVDVIVTTGNRATREAQQATRTIPIVMMGVQNPVGSGLVGSLVRPGANLTGLTIDVTAEQAGKNLELLKETVPEVVRVAIPRRTNVSTHMAYSQEAERAAKILGMTVQFAEVQASNDKHLEEALAEIMHEQADSLLVPPSAFFASRRRKIVDFAARNNLPAIYPGSVYVENGGLMSYGPSLVQIQNLGRRAAVYVDKILKGADPAVLPVEQPKQFDFVINLQTAKQIGVTIAPNVLARADRVIR